MIKFWPSLRTFAVTLQLELVYFRLVDYLIFVYFACLCCVVLPCVAWRNCVNKLHRFTVHNIHAYVLPCNEKNIPVCCQFTQLHSHQVHVYYWNLSTSDLVIVKRKGWTFFKHSVYTTCWQLLLPPFWRLGPICVGCRMPTLVRLSVRRSSRKRKHNCGPAFYRSDDIFC